MSATATPIQADSSNYGPCNGEKPTPAKAVNVLRITGIVLLILSVISIGIDIGVYTYLTNPKIGAFWIAVITIPAALLALHPIKKSIVTSVCVLTSIGCVVGLIGSIVDGIGASIVSNLKTCYTKSGKVYGDTNNFYAAICSINYLQYHDIVCTDNTSCLFYDGRSNGDDIMITYKGLLQAAVAFNVIITIVVFILSIFSCVNLCNCCTNQCGDSDAVPTVDVPMDPIAPTPVVATVEPLQAV